MPYQLYALKVDFTLENDELDGLYASLNPTEQKNVSRMKTREMYVTKLLSALLFKYSVANYAECDIDELVQYENEYGKPCLSSPMNVYANRSHSHEWIICIVDSYPVGIDIEHKAPIDLSLAEAFFNSCEKRYIYNAAEMMKQYDRFYEIWTIKESYLKYIGTGLYRNLDSFFIHREGIGYELTDYETFPTEKINVNHGTFPLNTNYALSRVVRHHSKNEVRPYHVNHISMDTIMNHFHKTKEHV
ncbi:4'-phosphopantetheinyl transferase family protein [Staphylococcus massiliensis]|uniref:4'-phosphopantetheinyl transferase family protein n=1 Tax=Staphylococcus massiliensis TaxID=555791 RepID=UPI0003177869|nr:4'-phosphopantetheinyl transferase superfamily protein [Staphylococcus massiliensis]MCG3399241.1 4'-phosphopantetheinyl transferase superfamily protein [Staphylococcus massiliensis]POA00564.1 phosphopantetheine--protein transferase [Staphylococcus massiliensis CCUG 55927]